MCVIEGCEKKPKARGLCNNHYVQARAKGELGGYPTTPTGGVCTVDGCDKKVKGRGLCNTHYQARRRSEKIEGRECGVESCSRPLMSKGVCDMHYQRERSGSPAADRNAMPDDHGVLWYPANHGYVGRRETDRATGKRLHFLQHRAVMESHLGRKLREGENVHHINGIRDDNRIENLELWSTRQPKGQRVEDKTAWAIEWLREYSPESLAPGLVN